MCVGLLPPDFAVVGVAREPLDDASFRAAMQRGLEEFASDGGSSPLAASLSERLFYAPGARDAAQGYDALRGGRDSGGRGVRRSGGAGRLFCPAIPPGVDAAV